MAEERITRLPNDGIGDEQKLALSDRWAGTVTIAAGTDLTDPTWDLCDTGSISVSAETRAEVNCEGTR